jgi:hypothetical protein
MIGNQVLLGGYGGDGGDCAVSAIVTTKTTGSSIVRMDVPFRPAVIVRMTRSMMTFEKFPN